MTDSLHLPTPESFPAFPFQPYDIQLELMKSLYTALEDRKIGKSLSLLCGAMTWLRDNKQRAIRGELEDLKLSIQSDDAEPGWVSRQMLDKHKRELEQAEADLEERLQAARLREEKIRQQERGRLRKRMKVADEEPDHSENDNAFLPDGDASDEEDNISPAVRDDDTEPEEPTCTKIYYASRTHTQLSQFLGELRKTHYQSNARTVPLGSRKNLCINDDVKKGKYGADIDEACRALASEKDGKRCTYLPPPDEEAKMMDMRDHILSSPKDIEDLEGLGRQTATCPYYGTRRAIKQAEVISPKDAHERESGTRDRFDRSSYTILAVHTVPVSSTILRVSKTQVDLYRSKFRNRLKTKHVVHLTRLSVLLAALQKFTEAWANGNEDANENAKSDLSSGKKRPPQEEMFGVAEFIRMLGAHAENINPLEIEKESKIISGYSDKLADAAAASGTIRSPNRLANARRKGVTPPLHAIESLLLALANPDEDGRIFLNKTGSPGAETVQLKYQLLNPSTHFREVVEKARSVVLAGGTMSPVIAIGDFHTQLFSYLPSDRLVVYSCGHVVPKSNIRTIVLGKGPRGKTLEFKFGARGDEELIVELGQTVLNLTNLVPNGFVVFLPSYAFLSLVKTAWGKGENKILERLSKKKKIFYEPQENGDVESVLREFSATASSPTEGLTGAILFAVVGAKLSEGLNFSDGLARAVAIVGLPFANLGSAELQARMKYVREHASSSGVDAGKECMRATNQSIGRAIRHRGDWAAIVFIDQRYGTPRIRSKLPGWIGTDLEVTDKFGEAMKNLGEFFRSKK
ncbi:CHL1 helicase [Rhizoctonia solani AG-1 IA]|uniref:ATP-dependent DNA helicase CHL1 n=1 Tax=Thanatephorus cucumeris (strain AG1-IA) TaxID=983506 RepID=L8WFM5_THACA|nr:CHL1 helicase [Rhizoctonia solani AG-1 IA]